MTPREPGDHFDHPERPTTEQPIGGPRRSPWKPLVVTVLVFAVLIALYLLGAATFIDQG